MKHLISKIDELFNLTLKVSQKNERIQRIFNDKLIRALGEDVFDYDDKEDLKDYINGLHTLIILSYHLRCRSQPNYMKPDLTRRSSWTKIASSCAEHGRPKKVLIKLIES